MDYVVAMVTRRGLMSLDGAVQDTEFLLSTWSTFRRWLKDEGLNTADGTVTFEALNKLEVIIVLLHKLNTKLKVFTGTAGNVSICLKIRNFIFLLLSVKHIIIIFITHSAGDVFHRSRFEI